jgi:hypothetical protein
MIRLCLDLIWVLVKRGGAMAGRPFVEAMTVALRCSTNHDRAAPMTRPAVLLPSRARRKASRKRRQSDYLNILLASSRFAVDRRCRGKQFVDINIGFKVIGKRVESLLDLVFIGDTGGLARSNSAEERLAERVRRK